MTAAANSALPWLAQLYSAKDAEALRTQLRQRHPGLLPGALKACAIVGTSGEGLRLAGICAANGITVAAICDGNPAMQGQRIGELMVSAPEAIMSLDRTIPVIVASHRGRGARVRLREAGFTTVELLGLLQVIAPELFTPHMFYTRWLEDLVDGRDHVQALAGRLADDASRRVLDALLAFRLTLDPDHLAPVVDWSLYLPEGLYGLGEDEVYVDAGTFDGDSIRLFIERTGGRFSRVIGFEPDPETFGKLAANFASDPRVEPINKGLWSRSEVLRFRNDASRGSILDGTGTVEVPVTSLDDVLNGDRVTFVKMNIEGAELEALNGARRSILAHQPILAVSAYHRPSDLWRVAETIDTIRPDYNLYLRQQDEGIVETVLYAVPPVRAGRP